MRWFAAIYVLLSSVLHAQAISNAPDDVEVTIYRDQSGNDEDESDVTKFGLAMIGEKRTVTLPAGRSVIRFVGVADAIVPQTAKLEGLPTPIVESNFDYDLLSPGALIAKSIGKPVRLVRTDRAGRVVEHVGILRSGPEGVVVDMNGKVEALGCGGLNERVVFDSLPVGLADKPTLSVTVNVPAAGRYALQLSYLTLGMNWSADYIATLNADGRTLDLSGWITLTNKLSASFPNVPVKVVAGNLSRDRDETVPQEIAQYRRQYQCWPSGPMRLQFAAAASADEFKMMRASVPMALEEVVVTGSFIAKQSELGDYKLYTLPERTTVAANQTKQVRMIDKQKVPFERVYVQRYYAGDLDEDTEYSPTVVLRLQNKKSTGLGLPLPAGVVSVMEPSERGQLVMAGEQRVQDIPVGLPIEIEMGQAMDVWVQPRVIAAETIRAGGRAHERAQIEIGMGNDKAVPIRLELVEEIGGEEDVRIVSESHRHTQKFGNPMWSFTLQPGERARLRYTVERAD